MKVREGTAQDAHQIYRLLEELRSSAKGVTLVKEPGSAALLRCFWL